MTEKRVKCPSCHTLNPKSITVEHNKRYYCSPCYELKTAPKMKTEWDYLFETIKKYYGSVTPVMFKQLKDYREQSQYKFTDAGMRLTLIYYHEVLQKPVEDKTTLGIIPYVYHKAKAHYTEVYRIQQVADAFVSTEQPKTVKVSGYGYRPALTTFDYGMIDWGSGEDE